MRHVLPAWTVRLLAGLGILPVLLVTIDGLARLARRRDGPAAGVRWALVGAVPFVLAALLPRLLGLLRILDAGPTLPGDAGGWTAVQLVSLVLCLAVGVAAWLGLRPVLLRLVGAAAPAASARAGGALTVALVAAIALWIRNPFAAALLVPALHLWIPAAVPDLRPGRRPALALALAGLVPAVIVMLIYAFAFDLGPAGLVRNALLGLAGGAVGVGEARRLVAGRGRARPVSWPSRREGRRPTNPPMAPSVRGPLSYAGPGSLGGTGSAIRRANVISVRGFVRWLSTVLIAAGLMLIADAVLTRRLAGAGERLLRPPHAGPSQPRPAGLRARAAPAGRAPRRGQARLEPPCWPTWPAPPRRRVKDGQALGRIKIPKIGASYVVVQGTDAAALRKGPGHYPETPLPGIHGTVAIAGHRTTYLAPFRRINHLDKGDRIDLDMPYGHFRYAVEKTQIVSPDATYVIRRVNHDRLVLSACHPLYSAAKRFIVFARLISATPTG